MDFVDLLQEHGIEYATEGNHHCRDGWVQIDCPFCGQGSGKYHLGYNLAGKYMNCWQCGSQWTPKVLSALLDKSVGECRRLLGDIEEKRTTPKQKKRGDLHLPHGVGPLRPAHIEYLRSRHYNHRELVRLWNIGGIGLEAHLAWRIFIPVYYQGEVVSWTTRSIGDRPMRRYVSAAPSQESRSLKDLLYGLDYCNHACVVHEGPFDVWRTGPGAVATLGLEYSTWQVLAISRFPVRAICFDAEQAAQKRAQKLADELSVFPGQTHVIELDSKDAGSASRREIKRIRRLFLGAK